MTITTPLSADEDFDSKESPAPTETVKPEEPKEQKKQVEVLADDQGRLIGSNISEQFRLATAYFQSGLMPKGLSSPQKVLVALQLCRELGLPPMSSIGKIGVIGQTPFIFGDLPLALVLKSGKLESIQEEWINEIGKEIGAKCTVKRVGMPAITREWTMADTERAKIGNKDTWKQYPRRMCQMRARGWALKDLFADVLSGVPIQEYDLDVAEKPSIAAELNEKFLAAPNEGESGV